MRTKSSRNTSFSVLFVGLVVVSTVFVFLSIRSEVQFAALQSPPQKPQELPLRVQPHHEESSQTRGDVPVDSVIFVKTYKVAGGTLKSILEREAKSRSLTVVPSNKKHPFAVTALHARSLNNTYDMLTKHAKYGPWMKKLVPNGVFITLVREPLQRAMSHYDHFNKFASTTTFEEFYTKVYIPGEESAKQRKSSFRHRDNMMALFLGYENLDQITVKSLQNRYSFIGIKEHFNESMVILSHVLRWNLKSMEYVYEHFNPKRGKKEPSENLKKLFKERNLLDYKLYDASLKIFNNKLSEYPNIEKETKEYTRRLERSAKRVNIIKRNKRSQKDNPH